MKPLNPQEPIRITQRDLPHWRQDGTTYFVTSRLNDSVPQPIADEWRRKRDVWLHQHGATCHADLAAEWHLDYNRLFTDTFHQLLDAGHGECLLGRRDLAEMLVQRMIAGHGTCYALGAWVIMPNHFHAIVEPAEGSVLGEIVRHWKGGSAFAIHRALGRRGTLWQKEPFDHIVRSEAQLKRLSSYVAENPGKANLKDGFVLGIGADVGLSRDELLQRCGSGL